MQFWILVGVKYFSFLQNAQTSSGAHPASYSVGTSVPSGGQETGMWS